MTEGTQLALDMVKRAFRPQVDILTGCVASQEERVRIIAHLRTNLAQILQFSPIEGDPVTVMKARAMIAAGFEAMLEELDQEMGLV
ncbi:hypothetical protein [Roseomonas xinghualingensis]|uniref:hypothetical protein n=1 Tax=Roseomonas xinghualingensis TaxID=2986475 RepID=UPI0021F169EC|nr:hypothetical protein [Roseomonas sp. SXEYE001]MCV4209708.1 hypothetical protein [Roseomonas sp. SXEYE001]